MDKDIIGLENFKLLIGNFAGSAMRPLISNRYIDAFVKMVSFFGITHLLILTLLAIHKNVLVLNAFTILDLDSFMPALGRGITNFVLSYCMVFVAYCLAFLFFTKPADKNSQPVDDQT